jgi:hypothetical protein
MAYVLYAVCAYVFMRAFEVLFNDRKDEQWYGMAIKVVALLVLYTAVAGILSFYFQDWELLGFPPN